MGTVKVVYDGAIHARLEEFERKLGILTEAAFAMEQVLTLDGNTFDALEATVGQLEATLARRQRQAEENRKAILRVDARVSQLEATAGEHEAAIEALRRRFDSPHVCPFCGQVMP